MRAIKLLRKYAASSQDALEKALVASGTQLTTVAMRRHSAQAGGESVFDLLRLPCP